MPSVVCPSCGTRTPVGPGQYPMCRRCFKTLNLAHAETPALSLTLSSAAPPPAPASASLSAAPGGVRPASRPPRWRGSVLSALALGAVALLALAAWLLHAARP